MFRMLLFILILLQAASVSAAVVTIDADFTSRLLGSDFEVYEDPSNQLTLAEIQTRTFVPNRFPVPAIGYSKSAFWYRFELQNASAVEQTLFLELAIAWIDHFILHYQEQGQWVQRNAGALHPMAERSVNHNLPTHRLILPPNSRTQFYIQLASSDTLVFPIYLRSVNAFASYLRYKDQLYGIFAGIMAVAAFYGFVFYVYTWNRAYLYYLFNTLSWLVMFTMWDGYGRELLFHDAYWWNKHANALAMGSSLFWGAFFTLKILEIERYSKFMSRLIYGWLVLQLILGSLALVLPYALMMKTWVMIAPLFPLLLIGSGVSAIRHGFSMGKYFMLSWTMPMLGVGLYNGMVVGLIPGSPLSMYALHFGILYQSLFLSFALSHHMKAATQNASILKVSVEAAGLAHSALMKSNLNPEHFEWSYRYRPCQESGGDLFSCLQDPRGRYSYLMVADVSGHGIAAAIISSAFTGAFNSAVKGMQSLDLNLEESGRKIMSDINLVMCDYFIQTQHFASAVLVAIDLGTGHAVYINAGHRNIFLKQAGKVSAFLRGGALIGFQASSQFHAVPLRLEPQDLLLLFTDGLVENGMGRSEKVRLDVIAGSLRESSDPQDIIERIWRPLGLANTHQSFDDDMTILVIKLKSLMAA